jgi:hypothetical protein
MSTVIVLGAGASSTVGFPTGPELVDNIARIYQDTEFLQILKRILWNNRRIIKENYPNLMPNGLLDQIENDPTTFIKSPTPQLSDWINLLPSADTIDDFIASRPEYSIFAKLGILVVLSEKEDDNYWRPNGFGKINRNWYTKVWNILSYQCKTAKDLFKRINNLSIITFNYDRSLDHYLYRQIVDRYRHTINELDIDILKAIKIFHIYGSIGDLPSDNSNLYSPYSPIDFNKKPDIHSPFYINDGEITNYFPREFGEFSKFDRYVLQQSLKIKTYNEEFIAELRTKYIDIIQSASYLYFFGFAFHPQNMDILFPKYEVKNNTLQMILGTCYNMPIPDIREASNRLSLVYGMGFAIKNRILNPQFRGIDIDAFLHDNGIEI